MCYDEGKLRIKPKANHPPLIAHKKHTQPRNKENQKHNYEPSTKPKNYHHHDPTSTSQFEHTHNYTTLSHQHTKERGLPLPHPHSHYHVQTAKALTFANVKQGHRQKDGPTLTEQSSFLGLTNEHKRPSQNKSNIVADRQPIKMTERSQKVVPERVTEKKDPMSKGLNLKQPMMTLDDFVCTQELDFKPVEKKSIVPEKKYNDKAPSKFDFAKAKKCERRNEVKEVKQFEMTENMINVTAEGESLKLSCDRQQWYGVDPNYLQKNHKGLIWWSRAILVDWMRHICYQFGLRRDTYHISIVLLDNYLASTNNVPKSILQAVGATCLFIASKLQEFQCKNSREFVQSTNNACSIQDIHELQLKIVKKLKFRLNPPTLSSLANIMMSQWDIFVTNDFGKEHLLFITHPKVHFKQLDEDSYRMFRQMMQMIDCSVIDVQTSQYRPKMLVCSFLYLLIGKQLQVFSSKQIVEEFPGSSLYLLDDGNEFNDLFGGFVRHVFGISLLDILPTVQYCATYFSLQFIYEQPVIKYQQDLQSMSLDEYCSYQTYNSTMIKTVKKRNRGLY